MIHGIGVDIVQVERVRTSLNRYGDRFARRILSDNEYVEFHSLQKPPQFLATRFAAKEAFAKALGTGFRNGLSLRDISVGHDTFGRPVLEYTGRAVELLHQFEVGKSHLSLSDESEYVLAFVTLEKLLETI